MGPTANARPEPCWSRCSPRTTSGRSDLRRETQTKGGIDETRSLRQGPADDHRRLPRCAHVPEQFVDSPSASRDAHDLHWRDESHHRRPLAGVTGRQLQNRSQVQLARDSSCDHERRTKVPASGWTTTTAHPARSLNRRAPARLAEALRRRLLPKCVRFSDVDAWPPATQTFQKPTGGLCLTASPTEIRPARGLRPWHPTLVCLRCLETSD